MITDSTRSVQIEVMKPGIFAIPEYVNHVAIFKRDFFQSDTCVFETARGLEIIRDSTIIYSDLSNSCVDVLSDLLEKQGYFQRVINYRDSMNSIFDEEQYSTHPNDYFDRTKADACIFLDYFQFKNSFLNFKKDYFYTQAGLSWLVVFKNDTSAYIYNQVDTLTFDETNNPAYRLKNPDSQQILYSAAQYLGKIFGTKLIPSWIPVERLYYKSKNRNMLIAEKLALNNDWLQAAEIWNRETKNTNPKIAAKASYNMALACEMEGHMDVGINWLVESYSDLTKNNIEHKANCQRYINILAIRKKDIERLDLQVRIQEKK